MPFLTKVLCGDKTFHRGLGVHFIVESQKIGVNVRETYCNHEKTEQIYKSGLQQRQNTTPYEKLKIFRNK